MEIALLIISLIALIPIGYFLWDRYGTKQHNLEIKSENTLFAKFISSGFSQSGNVGIAFHPIKIINSSTNNLTIKDVIFHYTIDGKKYSTESHVLLTSSLYSPLEKKDVNTIIIRNGHDSIVTMNWNNLRTEIANHNTVSPRGVLSGSALFVLNFNDFEAIPRLKNTEIVIKNYTGKETIHPIVIEDKWIENGKNAIIENRNFTINEAGQIEFA